jgi:hypothetical protein
MNKGPIWGQFMKKARGQKSRATVPLSKYIKICMACDPQIVQISTTQEFNVLKLQVHIYIQYAHC